MTFVAVSGKKKHQNFGSPFPIWWNFSPLFFPSFLLFTGEELCDAGWSSTWGKGEAGGEARVTWLRLTFVLWPL